MGAAESLARPDTRHETTLDMLPPVYYLLYIALRSTNIFPLCFSVCSSEEEDRVCASN